MVDIRTNLLKNRRTLSEKEYQAERNLFRWAVVALIIVIMGIMALSVWNLVLTRKLSGIEGELTKSSKDLQGLSTASAQQVYLKSRLKLVTGFLAERSIARESLQKIFSVNLAGSHISGMSFESESLIAVSYVANATSSLDRLLNYYESDTGYFTQAVSKGISRSPDGSYQMTILLTLPGGGT
jgi:hypothetical protein